MGLFGVVVGFVFGLLFMFSHINSIVSLFDGLVFSFTIS